uniref:YlmH/Sll1252 family protein n=1 Tax=Agathobacter sp. TaxID=2021311 RepID=UPI0040572FA1
MNEQELCKKRLLDLSKQADIKRIVTFSDFLNLNELNIYYTTEKTLPTRTKCFGGYDGAERQMVAFLPDALYYKRRTSCGATCVHEKAANSDFECPLSREYPICCIHIVPKYPKYAEALTHRDILGALMSLGIERGKLGDILCFEMDYYVFCEDIILPYILDNLTQIRHTAVDLSEETNFANLQAHIRFEERCDIIASNRIDCIVAKACHLSRSETASLLAAEKVFINGKSVTNCNQSCPDGSIISVRKKSRFIFESCNSVSKKGKLRVKFSFYK